LALFLSLAVSCSSDPSGPTSPFGTLKVTVRTTGANVDVNGYEVVVGTDVRRRVAVNGTVEISGVRADTYVITLQDIAENCSVSGTDPRSATLIAGGIVELAFEITCLDISRLATIAYVLDSVATGYSAPWIVLAKPGQSSAMASVKGQSPDWSPDGTRIVFYDLRCSGNMSCNPGLFVMDPETRTTKSLDAAGVASEPAWAPTGDAIAFVRPTEPGARVDRLYLFKLDGSSVVEIPTPGVSGVRGPAWSPDGKRIAFACAVRTESYDVCVINRDGTGFVRLTSQAQFNTDPAWSPNGRMIAFTITENQGWDFSSDIAVMAADGSGIRRVAPGFDPAWSPDGSRLVFSGPKGDGLFYVYPDGSIGRLTTGRHFSPAWRPTAVDPCYGCWDY